MARLLERLFFPLVMVSFVALLLTGVSAHLEHKIVIQWAGATFPAPLYARWTAFFEREHPNIALEYHPIGSGGGIKSITGRKSLIGASDALLNEAELKALPGELLQIPMVLGPVVIAYNLPGYDQNITMTGDVISDIYLHKIDRWNNPRLQALNPDITLPDIPVRVTHRKDSSGTTFIFTDYLTTVSPAWKKSVGRGKKVFWPVSHGAGEGNDGVAQQILLQPGGIGYLEYKYAENAGLKYARVVNREGKPVLPSIEGVQAAEKNTPPGPGTILKKSIVNAPGELSYPIAGFTYLLVYRDLSYLNDQETAVAMKEFLQWTLTSGQEEAAKLNYTPLPEKMRQNALELVQSITGIDRHASNKSDGPDRG